MKIRYLFLAVLFCAAQSVVGYQPGMISVEDSLRLLQMMEKEKSGNGPFESRNDDLKKLLRPVEGAEEILSKEEADSLNRLKVEELLRRRDTILITVDSIQKTISDEDTADGLQPFGMEIFKLRDKAAFEPSPIGPVDPEYILGPGDEILVSIWGDRELNYTMIVNRDGKVKVPDLGMVSVNGVSLKDFKEKIIKRLSKIYSSLRRGSRYATTFIDISLGQLRTVRVYVFGEVEKPGGYNLTGNANVWNALYTAGGPLNNGSLRDLQIVRNGKTIKTVDAYTYLLGQNRFADDRLENHDVLYVPARRHAVYFNGEVNRPAVFEVREKETVEDLLRMAGGFTSEADPRKVQIVRWNKEEKRKVLDVAYDQEESRKTEVLPGDSLYAFPLSAETYGYYVINGEVKKPGRFQWRKGLMLSEAIKHSGGVTKKAFLNRADVIHTHEDSTRSFETLDLNKVLNGETDMELSDRDVIAVYSIWMLKSRGKVSIWGEVQNPGYYDLIEGLSVEDLIFAAGGFTEKAYKKQAEVSRVELLNGEGPIHSKITRVPLSKKFFKKKEQRTVLLDKDIVFIRTNPEWKVQKNVVILGEVRFPGMYSLHKETDGIYELVQRAGGIKPTAYLPGAVFTRRKNNVGRIALDLEDIIRKKKEKKDIALENGDTLVIPVIPKTVKVTGEVGFPASILYKKGAGVEYYLENAGGLSENADPKHIKVILANGRAFRFKRWGFNPDVNAGSIIVVDKKPEKIPGRTLEILSQTVSIMSGILALTISAIALNNQLQ